jgi:hypothetical protein
VNDGGSGVTLWEQFLALGSAAILWLTGESGRVLIASGMGGFVRWMAIEKRRIRTGIAGITGGMIVGYYCWPIMLHVPRLFGADAFDRTPESTAMAGFLAGTMGVSGVKIFLAVLEARAARLAGGAND